MVDQDRHFGGLDRSEKGERRVELACVAREHGVASFLGILAFLALLERWQGLRAGAHLLMGSGALPLASTSVDLGLHELTHLVQAQVLQRRQVDLRRSWGLLLDRWPRGVCRERRPIEVARPQDARLTRVSVVIDLSALLRETHRSSIIYPDAVVGTLVHRRLRRPLKSRRVLQGDTRLGNPEVREALVSLLPRTLVFLFEVIWHQGRLLQLCLPLLELHRCVTHQQSLQFAHSAGPDRRLQHAGTGLGLLRRVIVLPSRRDLIRLGSLAAWCLARRYYLLSVGGLPNRLALGDCAWQHRQIFCGRCEH